MMNAKKFLQMCLFLGLCLTFFVGSNAQAKNNRVKSTRTSVPVTFMIQPKFPKDNLGGQHSGYFNLKVKPHHARSIQVQLINPTNQKLVVETAINDVTMKSSPKITPNYMQTKHQKETSTHPLSQAVKLPAKVTLKAHQRKWLKVQIDGQPAFKGQKAAALQLSSVAKGKGTIQNRFVYTIALITNGQKLKHYQKLDATKIETKLVGKRGAFAIHLTNPDPSYLMAGKMKVSLINQKWHFFNYQQKLKQIKIAPNAKFTGYLYLNGKRLVPGVYKMKLKFENDRYKQTINRYVQVTKDDARYINRYNYAYLMHRRQILIMIGTIVLLLLVVGFFIRKRKRNKIDKTIK